MKGMPMRKLLLVCTVAASTGFSGAEIFPSEGRERLSAFLYRKSSIDDLAPEEVAAAEAMTFFETFGWLQSSTGWSRDRILSELTIMATNGCSDVSMATNTVVLMAYDWAVYYLGKFGGTNALPALDYVIRNGYGDEMSGTAISAYVDIAGRSADAFAYYSDCMVGTNRVSNDKMMSFYVDVTMKLSQPDLESGEISNRVNRLIYAVSTNNVALQIGTDRDLCLRWPGYARSANRRRRLESILAAPENPHVSARLAPVLAELHSSTNLVELSVEDFLSSGE